jgi:hypothetical protein
MTLNIYTVKQTAQEIPALSEAAIRWQLFHRNSNGLIESGAIIHNGRRILIDLPLFVDWLRNQPGPQ